MRAFTAHCARNHDRIDFTDREAFELHMTGEHGARKRYAGQGGWSHPISGRRVTAAPGWGRGEILEPYPHKAAGRTAGGIDKVTERIAAGDYTWPSGFRWKDDTPAAEVMAS